MSLVLFELFSLLLLETALLLCLSLRAVFCAAFGFLLLALRGKRLHGFCTDPSIAQLLLRLTLTAFGIAALRTLPDRKRRAELSDGNTSASALELNTDYQLYYWGGGWGGTYLGKLSFSLPLSWL